MAIMIKLGAVMGIGILIGTKADWVPCESRARSRFQKIVLFVLLLVLGYQLGSNKEILQSLSIMGLRGFVLAIIAMLGSFFSVRVVRLFFERRGMPS